MILAIDVGNTNTVMGLLKQHTVFETFRISTKSRTTDELGMLLLSILGHRGVRPEDIEGAIISSVVPSVLYGLEKACRRYLNVTALVVGRKCLSLIHI